MRILLALTFALAACGGSSGNKISVNNDGGPTTVQSGDMATKSTGSTDMAMATAAGTANCKATIDCFNGCAENSTTQAQFDTCNMGCQTAATSAAYTAYMNFVTCVGDACFGADGDMAASPCGTTATSQSSTACTSCQMTAEGSGGACATQSQACAAN